MLVTVRGKSFAIRAGHEFLQVRSTIQKPKMLVTLPVLAGASGYRAPKRQLLSTDACMQIGRIAALSKCNNNFLRQRRNAPRRFYLDTREILVAYAVGVNCYF